MKPANSSYLLLLALCMFHTACVADEKKNSVDKIFVSDAPVTINGELWVLAWAEEFDYAGKASPNRMWKG